jgi:hypothetical protein
MIEFCPTIPSHSPGALPALLPCRLAPALKNPAALAGLRTSRLS